MMKSDVYDTNMIWEFYLKYIVKNIKDLESVQFKTPQHDITNRVFNIMGFDTKVEEINDKIVNIVTSSPDNRISKHEINLFNIDNVIRRIRTVSEYLKNLNRLFFLSKHVDENGTVKIISIAKDLGYNNEESKKLRLLLFHDIRNALSHINYEYKYDNNGNFKSITWFDMNKKPHESSDKDLIEILKKSGNLLDMYGRLYRAYFTKNKK